MWTILEYSCQATCLYIIRRDQGGLHQLFFMKKGPKRPKKLQKASKNDISEKPKKRFQASSSGVYTPSANSVGHIVQGYTRELNHLH